MQDSIHMALLPIAQFFAYAIALFQAGKNERSHLEYDGVQ